MVFHSYRKKISHFKTFFWRRPKEEFQRMFRWGPKGYFLCDSWMKEMEAAAFTLPQLPASSSQIPKPLWFMTGEKHWYQTAFCAWSFARHSRHSIKPVLIDDGTLGETSLSGLRRLFPDLIVDSRSECDERVERLLPIARFPKTHWIRSKQKLFRKLTDIHAGASDWRLFFDSDMLFFKEPEEIDRYLDNPSGHLAQRDCWESYGFSRGLTEKLCGHRLPEALNIGIFSMNGSLIDWEQVEHWIGEMFGKEGSRYNVTQCTSAMLMAGRDLHVLDSEDYKVFPANPTRPHRPRVLEHYVQESKPWYFGEAWKLALNS